jgi:ATP-binding cassette subfamily B protein
VPENSKSDSQINYQRIGVGEFFKITKWALGLLFNIYPVKTILWLLSTVTNRVQPLLYTYIFARAIDALIKVAQTENASIKSMYPYLWWLLLYSIITTIISFVGMQSLAVIRQTSRPLIRRNFYTKLHSLGIETLEQPGVNDKIARAEDYLGNIMPFLSGTVQLIAICVTTITAATLIFSFMPFFAPIIILISVPYVFYDKHMRMKIYKFDYENTEDRRKAGNSAAQLASVYMLQEIISTNALRYLDDKYIKFQTWLNSIFVKLGTQSRTGGYIFGFITDVVILYGYVLIFLRLIGKVISVGDVFFWMRSLDMLQRNLSATTQGFNDQFELSIQLKDTYTLFNTKPVYTDGTKLLPKLEKGPKIEFVNVDFKYPRSEDNIIENLNLEIKPGEKLAIVGKNGAGKTTLTKLISRFYPVTSGGIRINGININELKASSIYQNMGVLFQDFNTYNQLTVKENIYIGRSDEPLDEVRMRIAAQTADAMEFINPTFKGGIRLSSGQWQKLAIARFFYRNAPLVIFDEPTASIDAVSEYNIFNKIYDFFENKTVIIISHRFSTVRNADRIIVLDKGKIVEDGNHKELMALGGKYCEAFRLQAKGYDEEDKQPEKEEVATFINN